MSPDEKPAVGESAEAKRVRLREAARAALLRSIAAGELDGVLPGVGCAYRDGQPALPAPASASERKPVVEGE